MREAATLDMTSAVEAWEATPNYHTHPVVRRMASSGKVVVPLALYLDAAEYGVRDSMLVVTLTNLASGKNHVLCILRKRLMCGTKAGCGCRGWCTLFPLWVFLRWSFESLACGRFPARRHESELDEGKVNEDGWRPEDAEREGRAGMEMDVAGALLQIRADWAEMSSRLGVSSWKTSSDPCFLCKCNQETMLDPEKLRMHGPLPWNLRDSDDYEQACRSCEIKVRTADLPDAEWKKLLDDLEVDIRKDGARGLALKRAWPRLRLKKGDRLEPCMALTDWNRVFTCRKPEEVVFWRRALEGAARRRNPLFSKELGTTLSQACTIDTMHAWCWRRRPQDAGSEQTPDNLVQAL